MPRRTRWGSASSWRRKNAARRSSTSIRVLRAPRLSPTSTRRCAAVPTSRSSAGSSTTSSPTSAYFKEYVAAYTNAAYLVKRIFKDTEDLDGLFSGYDPETLVYDFSTWTWERDEKGHIKTDPTMQHERCVMSLLRRHYSRYTAEMVERVCGTPRDQFLTIAETLAKNSGRERTTAFAYALGWTQHSDGVQFIRTAAVLQMLLGNIGRPGGGIMALRGHADIQGATDIATLFDLLPGYLPMPSANRDEQTLADYLKSATKATGWWVNTPKYVISLLKAFYGDAATKENDYCFEYLPQLIGDHSQLPTTFAMKDGTVKGYFVIGQNPGASGQNAEMTRAALESLEWFVNIDSYDNETVSFWRREGANPSEIATEVFFLPARDRARKRRHDDADRAACCKGTIKRSSPPAIARATRTISPGSPSVSKSCTRDRPIRRTARSST